jgi:glycine dehydrogenase subunit 1
LPGYQVETTQPFLKEFVVRCPRPASEVNAHLFDEWGIIGGYDLSDDYANRPNQMLLCVTEMNTREEIDALVEALGEMSE